DCRHIAARLGRKRPVRQFLPCFEAEDSTEGGLLHCGISKEPLSAVGSIWSNRRARDGLVMSASVRSRPNRSGLCTRRGSSPQLRDFRNLVRLLFKWGCCFGRPVANCSDCKCAHPPQFVIFAFVHV